MSAITNIHDASEAYKVNDELPLGAHSLTSSGPLLPSSSSSSNDGRHPSAALPQRLMSEQRKTTFSVHPNMKSTKLPTSSRPSVEYPQKNHPSLPSSSRFQSSIDIDDEKKADPTLRSRSSKKTGKSGLSALQNRDLWMPSGWSGRFLLVVILEAIIVVSMVSTAFAKIEVRLANRSE